MLPQPWLQEICKHVWISHFEEFLESKNICDDMCLYILTQSLNKYWLQLLKSIDCIRLCNHKYAIFSFNPVIRHSMTHTNRKIWQIKMLNIILSIKRTQVHCTQILSTLFTCLHVMINTDVKQNEMQTWCQQRNKSSKRWPPQLRFSYYS